MLDVLTAIAGVVGAVVAWWSTNCLMGTTGSLSHRLYYVNLAH
jgi:uncharacterized membrane protein YeaQ/YmgE (transglycosylase-associated protein family)